jgi:hypothetical protein
LANPIAFGPRQDGLSASVLERRTDAEGKKGADDFALRGLSLVGAAAPATGVLDGQMKSGGTGFIFTGDIGTGFQQASDCLGASGADRPMQGCRSVLVLGMNIGSGLEQQADHRDLALGVPGRVLQITVGGVMEGLAMAVVGGGADVCASCYQDLGDFDPEAGCRDVQGCVTGIYPVCDSSLEPGALDHLCRQAQILLEQRLHPHAVIVNYRYQ